jgi:hypothetical protein
MKGDKMKRRTGIIFIISLMIICSGCAGYYEGSGAYYYPYYYDYPYNYNYGYYYDYPYYYPNNYYFFYRGEPERLGRHGRPERHESQGRGPEPHIRGR